jgi:hypothetical protein
MGKDYYKFLGVNKAATAGGGNCKRLASGGGIDKGTAGGNKAATAGGGKVKRLAGAGGNGKRQGGGAGSATGEARAGRGGAKGAGGAGGRGSGGASTFKKVRPQTPDHFYAFSECDGLRRSI